MITRLWVVTFGVASIVLATSVVVYAERLLSGGPQ